MNSALQMSDTKRAVVFAIMGLVCMLVCGVVVANPFLRMMVLAGIVRTGSGVLAMTAMSIVLAASQIAQEKLTPAWLRVLGTASVISAGGVFLVAVAVLKLWVLLVLLALFFVVLWFVAGRPKIMVPTAKEFNRG